jgi:hypothetical protein
MDCSACIATGTVDMFGAQVGGQLWLGAARLSSGDSGWALSAPLFKVGGGMYCNAGFSATGGVNLFGAAIGSMLDFAGGTLTDPDGTALRGPGCTVQTDEELDRLDRESLDGELAESARKFSASVRGKLDCIYPE